jgi:hypothetical protein
VLQNLHHRNPLRGTEKIRIYVGQTCLFFDDAYKQMGENTNSLLIIILCMVGLDSPDHTKDRGNKKTNDSKVFQRHVRRHPKKSLLLRRQNGLKLHLPRPSRRAPRRQPPLDLNRPTFLLLQLLHLPKIAANPSFSRPVFLRQQPLITLLAL